MSRLMAVPSILVALLLLAMLPGAVSAAPRSASASTLSVNCAVGYAPGTEYVVEVAGSTKNQSLVQDSAAWCTQQIQSGDWTAADKFADWPSKGYQVICSIYMPNGTEQVDLYSWTDYDSRLLAYNVCLNARDNGGYSVRLWEE